LKPQKPHQVNGVGKIKCAFLEIINFDLRSKLNLAKPSTSL
jgi:hypothetical protein